MGMIEQILRVMGLGTKENSNYLQFSFISYTEVTHIEIQFGILIYHNLISRSSLIFGMIEPFSTEIYLIDLEKFQLFAVVTVHFLCRGCTY